MQWGLHLHVLEGYDLIFVIKFVPAPASKQFWFPNRMVLQDIVQRGLMTVYHQPGSSREDCSVTIG